MPDALVRVDIDESSGAIKVYQEREVVEEVEDDEMEISLKEAQAISKNYQLGDLVDEEVNIQEFGRAAVILAKNVMKQKIREAEKHCLLYTSVQTRYIPIERELLTLEQVDSLRLLRPFGNGFEEPLFCMQDLTIADTRRCV